MLQQAFTLQTQSRGAIEITAQVAAIVSGAELDAGLCHVFIRHTSASVMINENADATVLDDIEMYLASIVQDGDPRYRHNAEGPDDMAAHFLLEHRYHPHQRQIIVSVQH